MLALFLIISTVLFFFLSCIWSKNGWYNVLFKLMFMGMGIWGVVLSLMAFGFVIRG